MRAPEAPAFRRGECHDFATDAYSAITNTPEEIERSVRWLPDGQHFVYAVDDLFLVDRTGPTITALTDLEVQRPAANVAGFACWPDQATWSAIDARIYYAVVYISVSDETYDALFSVSLAGDNRLEIDLPSLTPGDTYNHIIGIHPNTHDNTIYLVTNRESMDSDGVHAYWHVTRLDQPGQQTLIAEKTVKDFVGVYLYVSALSPDGQQLAFGGMSLFNGYVAAVDLTSGQIWDQTTPRMQIVCDVEWLDAHLFQYTHEYGTCDAGISDPGTTWQLDTDTYTIEQVSSGLPGDSWVLPTTR